jgi:FkbM family methyltransferase
VSSPVGARTTHARSLFVRAVDATLGLYSRIAPTGRGGYRLARLARRFHAHDDQRALFRTPDGLRFHLDLATYPDCCMAFGLYELDTARVIRRLLRPGDTFIDGGANIGYFTLIAAKAVGPSGRVHAFEPQPDNRRRLAEHVAMNGFADIVTIHPVALSDSPGEVELHTYENPAANHGQSTLFALPGAPTRKVSVATVRLDDYLPSVVPRLIKLDIEGAEPPAITGMSKLLRAHRPAVIVELNATTLGRAGFATREPLDRLLAAVPEYEPFVIAWRLKRLDVKSRVERLGEVNLLFEVPSP